MLKTLRPAPKAAPQLQIQPKTGARLDGDNLGLLGEFVRKDPESYKDDFDEQMTHFIELGKLLQIQPAMHRMDVQPLLELTTFLSGVAYCFPENARTFGENLDQTLRAQGSALDPNVRLAFIKAIVTLRNRNLIDMDQTLNLFFELLKCEDKPLRKFLLGAIIGFIRRHHKKFHRPDSKFQAFVFAKIKDSRAIIARSAELILIDAFRRQFWRDAKTANAISQCVFNKHTKIQVTAMRFFLGSSEQENGEGSDSDMDSEEEGEDKKTIKEVMTAFRHTKKTKKRAKQLEDAKKAINKEKKKKKEKNRKNCNLEAMRMLYDPQTLCERLFAALESKKNERYVVRLLYMALVARLIGVHQLQVLGFYSYLHKFLQPKQKEVTRILLYAAQACHETVPSDLVEGLIKVISNNFVSDNNSHEAITVGLNAIREIFANCPFAATSDVLEDLSEYKNYKNKNVSMAARGLLQLFRAVNPAMLRNKYRGRPTDADSHFKTEFGQNDALDFLPGAEVLNEDEAPEAEEKPSRKRKRQQSEDSESSWIDIDDSGSEIEIATDSEDENDVDDDEEGVEDDEEGVEDDEEGVEDDENELEGAEDEYNEIESDEEGVEDDDEEEEDEDENEETDEPVTKKMKKVTFATKAEKKKAKKLEKKLTAEAALEKARSLSENRIFTDEDFKKIKAHQMRKQLAAANPNFKNKNLTNDDMKLKDEVAEVIGKRSEGATLTSLNDITHFHKKIRRQTKAERLEQIKEGRGDKDMYKKRKNNGPHVGRTNANMAKNKNFQMVRQKVRGKNRQRSFRDQQRSLRTYLLKQAGRKPGNM
ncbi:unnamed protein product [Bursaphelenchus okinawaensis]|uniref:Protein SDA1 n=1 Tax=Bursaphelenchus okinawaensis TaxID=465554 RepID=A0A811L5J8_9BILA|nr:unnamed protein product [Bursaphelenchus okinawaensis]CAG9117739.1 unnamed protein product [Bursaphelenchus okinawaensis]